MADFSLNVKLNGVEQAVSTVGELEAALKATKQELKTVDVGSEAFDNLTKQARTLQNELKEVKEATNFDRNLGQLGESVSRLGSSITSAFTIATSAASLFGDESKELSEAQIKAQQALALALSATTIAANAGKLTQDLKNISDALGLNLTRAKVAATEQETAVESANTVATAANAAATEAQAAANVTATVTQRGLNAAMAANPIGLLVVGLTALVSAIVLFGDSEEEAAVDMEKLNQEMKQQNELIKQQYNEVIKLEETKGKLYISEAKNEEERLARTKEVEDKINSLKISSLKQQEKVLSELNQANLNQLKKYEDAFEGTIQVLDGYTNEVDEFGKTIGQTPVYTTESIKLGEDQIKKIADLRNQDIINLQEQLTQGKISTEGYQTAVNLEWVQYYQGLIDIQLKYVDEAEGIDNEKAKKDLENLQKNYAQVATELQAAYNEQLRIQDEAKAKENEANQKALDEKRKQYKDAYDKIKKDVADTLKELQQIEDDNRAEIAKLGFKTKQEEVQFEFDQEKAKIDKIYNERRKQVENDKTLGKERNTVLAQLDLEYFETVKSLIDLNKIESDNALKEDLKKTQETNDAKAESDRQYAIIKGVLNQEISYGDQNVLDTRAALQLKAQELELQALEAGYVFKGEREDRHLEERNMKYVDYLNKRLDLILDVYAKEQALAEQQARAEAVQREENFKETINEQVQDEQQRAELLTQFQQNNEYQLQEDLKRIKDEYNLKNKEAAKQTEDEILAYRLEKINEYASFAVQGANSVVTLLSNINAGARQEEEQAINEKYSKEQDALNRSLNAGLISRKEYDAQNKALNDKREKAEYEAKKKAFEQEKKLKIAQAIIAGAQGALSAFTGAMQLGPIAGPIVGGILAALVVAATAVQVANISKQKFDGGAVPVTPIDASAGAGGAVDTGASAVNNASGGGFTGFTPNLTGGGATSPGGTPTGSGGGQRVYVLESDITDTQNRVRAYESNATF